VKCFFVVESKHKAKMSDKCPRCNKTVYKQEEIKGAGKVWHKLCFKCKECGLSLTEKTLFASSGDIYCKVHVPKAKATQVADSKSMEHALNAPKKASEALGTVHKGAGGAGHYTGVGPKSGGVSASSSATSFPGAVADAPPPPEAPPAADAQAYDQEQYEQQPAYDQHQYEQPPADQQQYDQQ